MSADHRVVALCGVVSSLALGLSAGAFGQSPQNQPLESVTPWFHGQVIDMLFFPLFDFVWPHWVPYLGGEEFLFFSPVFNIADSSIFVGVATILIFQKKFFPEAHKKHDLSDTAFTNSGHAEIFANEVGVDQSVISTPLQETKLPETDSIDSQEPIS